MTAYFESLPTELASNPLLEIGGLPKFDQIEAGHVEPAMSFLLDESEKALTQLEENIEPTWAGCFKKLEELDRPFEYCWGPVSHLLSVKNSDELREAYESVLDAATRFGLRMSQSKPIYEAAIAIRDGDEWSRLDAAQQRIVEKSIQSAERSGIALEGEARERFNEIAQELSQLSTKFSNNVLDSTKAWELVVTEAADVGGLPDSAMAMAAQSYNSAKSDDDAEGTAESGPWRFTLDGPSFLPFMQHCRNRELREQVYRAFVSRASDQLQDGEFDNSQLIDQILTQRDEKAKLLGFGSFAELSLDAKMAPGVEAVEEVLETLREASIEAGKKDLDELRELAAAEEFSGELMHWDLAFWAERLREKKFDYTDEDLRPYLPLERVLDGMFALTQKLFGIQVRKKDGVPVWHDDVRYFEVLDENNQTIAEFYLDPFSRPADKRGGAWMNTCLSRREVDGVVQIPVAHLICNSTPPVGDQPSLMTFREVETLFHEFGHGLQHMLTVIDHVDAAGINGIEWDAVELPSQFMENWCYHRATMEKFSGHVETGEPIPTELFEKLTAARTFRAGTQMLRQLNFGMTDLALHGGFLPGTSGESAFDVQRQIGEKTSVMPALPEDRFLCGFSHIFAGGYAAGYYSYKWAEILSADAFSAFEEVGLDNDSAVAEKGRKFRETVLALGGSRHPLDVFKDFRGREPDPKALLRHSGLA
jgi:oligopeptidase A